MEELSGVFVAAVVLPSKVLSHSTLARPSIVCSGVPESPAGIMLATCYTKFTLVRSRIDTGNAVLFTIHTWPLCSVIVVHSE